MITLSIFCSTQTMSVALFENEIIIKSLKKNINQNKIDDLSVLVQEILSNKSIKKVDRILFSKGPGSYTACRSIKALAQGLSIAKDSKVIALDNFEIYLGTLEKNYRDVFVYFKDVNDKFFFKSFTLKKTKYVDEKNFMHVDKFDLKKKVMSKLGENQEIMILGDEKVEEKFSKNIKNIYIDALDLAKAFFKGYGSEKLDIIYHHTYYS